MNKENEKLQDELLNAMDEFDEAMTKLNEDLEEAKQTQKEENKKQ